MKSNYTSIKILAFLMVLALGVPSFAQDAATGPDTRPVTGVFNSSLLIDQQTNVGPYKHGLELIIHHRFGTMDNGFTALHISCVKGHFDIASELKEHGGERLLLSLTPKRSSCLACACEGGS